MKRSMGLSDSSRSKDLDQFCFQVKNLFKTNFIANCHLDDASITEEELETLEELEPLEVLENLKDLIESLITFKTNLKQSNSEELAVRCEKLEKMLQKQEADVRKHIGAEHQLRLLVETLNQKNDELKVKYENAQLALKTLENSNGESINEKISKLESHFVKEISNLTEKYKKDTQTKSAESEKLKKLEEMFKKKEKNYSKLSEDFNLLKSLLEKTTNECISLRKEIEKHSSPGSKIIHKRKHDLIESSLNKVHTINRSMVIENHRKSQVYKKKSDEALLKGSENLPLSDVRNISVKTSLHHSKRHLRSNSDYTHPSSWKKINFKQI